INDTLRAEGDDAARARADEAQPWGEARTNSQYSHVWRSKDHDYPCTPTGEEHHGSDGRVYARVRTPDGSESFVPKDELFPKGVIPDEGSIPADTMQVIRDGVEEDKQRRRAFWNVMMALKRRGFTVDGIIALLEKYPDGIAKRHCGRLRDEIEWVYGRINASQPQAPGYEKGGDEQGQPIVHWHGESDPLDSRPQLIQDL